MRRIDAIVIHQSASAFGNVATIDAWHTARGWKGIGYHRVILNGCVEPGKYVLKHDGLIQAGRPLEQIGAHVAGHNAHSIGICLIGAGEGWPVGVGYLTAAQWRSLVRLCALMMGRFAVPVERVLGHREFPGVAKTCPGFEVAELRRALGEA